MEQKRGLLVFAAMGSGKTYFVDDVNKSYIMDGDVLLKNLGIKNRNDFWYDAKYYHEQQKIIDAFIYYLNLGYWIFYSGNPTIMFPDVIVLPDKEERWNRLQNRIGYRPTKEKFLLEQKAYENASRNTFFYINGDIPSLDMFQCMYNEIIRQNK